MRGRFPPIWSSRFPIALFGIILAGLMLASGIHMGFIILLTRLELSAVGRERALNLRRIWRIWPSSRRTRACWSWCGTEI